MILNFAIWVSVIFLSNPVFPLKHTNNSINYNLRKASVSSKIPQMANRKRCKSEDNQVSLRTTPSQPAREILPRRCKATQPNYGIDNDFGFDFDDEYDQVITITRKKKEPGLSPMSRDKMMITRDEGQPSQRHAPQKAPFIVAGEGNEKKEEMISSSILSWLVEMNVVQKYQIIAGVNEINRGMGKKGEINRDGIHCYCCGEMYSVSEFQFHIQGFFGEKPYEKMFIAGTGTSLLTCQIEAWNRHSVPARDGYHHVERRPRVRDHHDDTCVICADGGDLLCCEQCPSTYHLKCLGFQSVPQAEWLCPYCCCKYCGGKSPLLLTCSQCLKKYHWRCYYTNDIIYLFNRQPTFPFCGKKCWQLHGNLERMVGRTMTVDKGFSWTLVRRTDLGSPVFCSEDLYWKANSNSLVVLAAKLMEDSFKRIFDRQTGTNMIQNVVYSCGSNFIRTNFSRFYTVVLQYRGLVVSAASLRTPSPELTEIPFIATAESWRKNGMCKNLLLCIESFLIEFGMERIVIPSSESMVRHWEEKFGFIPIDETVKTELANLNTLMFPKTTRLQKVLRNPRRVKLNDLNLPPPEN